MSNLDASAAGDWARIARSELSSKVSLSEQEGVDGIAIKTLYTEEDLRGAEFCRTYPGTFPFVRGHRATMYASRPWTIRQYAGFSTADESNAFYRRALAMGQKGLSVAFDLPTHRGYDSDDPRVAGEVGKAGVAIDSVEDMKRLFEGIPLGDVSVSMTMNGAVVPILASFIVAAEEQGVSADRLSGTIQNDILKEFMVRNTYIYPPKPSMRIAADIIAYASRFMPRYNPISISGYHMQEAGAPADLELGYALADGLAYVRAALSRGLCIDDFAPRLSFFFGVGMNIFTEIAKLRAARLLWASLLRERFSPKCARSLELRMHCQTSGVSLTAQDPLNNVARTAIEALAAVLGGTQSLHTNAYDEALALPSDEAARIALQTQLILAHECGITHVVDPLGGSYFVESLTASLVGRARKVIEEIESLGGMPEAIASGIPKLRIEEAAARRQARLDRGLDVIVGVNKYRSNGAAMSNIRMVDDDEAQRLQAAHVRTLRRSRDQARVERTLAVLQSTAEGDGNVLEASLEAVRARATIGEVTEALALVFGRHKCEIAVVSSVYSYHHGQDSEWEAVTAAVRRFEVERGRRPRILVAKLGQDGHDRGSRMIASAFADLGFDVDVAPMFQSYRDVARQAVENDVDVVGVSTHAGGHSKLVPALLQELRTLGATDTRVVVGGIVPQLDAAALAEAGVAAVFGPGTNVLTAARGVLEMLGIPVLLSRVEQKLE